MSRRVTLPEASTYDVSVTTRGRPGAELDALGLEQDSLVNVEASSTGVADPRASALAAVDGSSSTTWSADLSDVRPSLDLRWLQPQTIDSIEINVAPDTAARAPQTLELRWPGGTRDVESTPTAPPRSARSGPPSSRSTSRRPSPRPTLDFDGRNSSVPVGITDLELGGARGLPLRLDDQPLDLGCGTGPDLDANGIRVQTSVAASARDLFEGSAVPALRCGSGAVPMRAGDNLVRARVLRRVRPPVAGARPRPAPARGGLAHRRRLRRHRDAAPRAGSGQHASSPASRTPTPAGWPSRAAPGSTRSWSTDGGRAGLSQASRTPSLPGSPRGRRTAGRSWWARSPSSS